LTLRHWSKYFDDPRAAVVLADNRKNIGRYCERTRWLTVQCILGRQEDANNVVWRFAAIGVLTQRRLTHNSFMNVCEMIMDGREMV
jgi:hypothetical protein